ncbi:MAG: hypothetical protein JOZ63_09825 [Planctomycetaceae bacterium]|nr:hypothetical protein [Planctomycetaceae bacterium]
MGGGAGASAGGLPTRFDVTDYGAKRDNSTDNVTAFTALAAVVNAHPQQTPYTIYFPDGNYLYTGGLNFTTPVILMGSNAAVLDYSGTGNAVTFGQSTGLNINNYQLMYKVQGLTFTGGASMANGIRVNPFITMPYFEGVFFYNFGNASAAGIYFAGDNWDSKIYNCTYYTNLSRVTNWVWVGQENLNSTRLRVNSCLGTVQGDGRGYGFRFNGFANEIVHSKIEGWNPAIIIGPLASNLTINGVYFENTTNNGLIQYGQEPADPINLGNYLSSLSISNCYANLHFDDLGYTGPFLAPRNTQTGLQGLFVENLCLSGQDPSVPVVKLNIANGGQSGAAVNIQGASGPMSDTYAGFWNGVGVTFLNASNISSGTLTDARLSSNVPLKNATNIFSCAASNNAIVLRQAANPTADPFQVQSPAAAVLMRVKADGSIGLPKLTDVAATNNSLYWSSTTNKVTYKDQFGIIHIM